MGAVWATVPAARARTQGGGERGRAPHAVPALYTLVLQRGPGPFGSRLPAHARGSGPLPQRWRPVSEGGGDDQVRQGAAGPLYCTCQEGHTCCAAALAVRFLPVPAPSGMPCACCLWPCLAGSLSRRRSTLRPTGTVSWLAWGAAVQQQAAAARASWRRWRHPQARRQASCRRPRRQRQLPAAAAQLWGQRRSSGRPRAWMICWGGMLVQQQRRPQLPLRRRRQPAKKGGRRLTEQPACTEFQLSPRSLL